MVALRVYAVCRPEDPPVRGPGVTFCHSDPVESSVALPEPFPGQLVVFSFGEWSGLSSDAHIDVAVVGDGAKPHRLGSLSSRVRCLHWECDGDAVAVGRHGLRLQLVVQGQQLPPTPTTQPTRRHSGCVGKGKTDGTEIEVLSSLERTPQTSTTEPCTPVVKGAHGKRKRSGRREEEVETPTSSENTCPNFQPLKNATPQRRPRPSSTAQARLFTGHVKAACERDLAATPTGRWGHAVCTIDNRTAILIGGQGSRMQFCKDAMWKLSTEDSSWGPAETIADGPTPECRIGHTATFDPDSGCIYVFGGSKNKKWFNDVHILDTKSWKWSTVEARGRVPPLAYHSSTLFRGELFVFGGLFPRPNPQPDGCSNILYIFDAHQGIWYQPIVVGDKPSARSGHSACLLQRNLYIFGGWDTPFCFNDMHCLDLGLMEFSLMEVSGTCPSPRSWHSSAVVTNTRFLIHGGYDGNQALGDTFSFDTAVGRIFIQARNVNWQLFIDLERLKHCTIKETKMWMAIVHQTLPMVPRAGHSMIPLASLDVESVEEDAMMEPVIRPRALLIFGGGDNKGMFYADSLILTLTDIPGL